MASSLACHSLSDDGGTSLTLLAQVTSPWRCGNERHKSTSSDGSHPPGVFQGQLSTAPSLVWHDHSPEPI
ncbi:unnamed protein product [Prunus armeniaca]|uniref:Uncharacterized protein n=1 Tax=Prunus armeniaca TaxID=36596 RepID=A0A6J5Y1G8_PRUAR|nr:unnamed protein product [Prunus armeniaca]CAB4318353.1 unnamed protein product [Prunus armeniaca]